jgi:hypothetical protein
VKTLTDDEKKQIESLKRDSTAQEHKGFAYSGESGATPQIMKGL